ncbi:MAG: hypothetical protein CUR33_09125 [Pseudomonas sp.]|uniref:hypothetical protein n=1 Tax=Pseudomonas sp. FEMGT703P TaxID=2080764 RepID=UPI000CBBE701|nr:hypothetical protein [Pseudomonas sp. FEMGT703P]PJE43428.1 MAG: hypothetical protein CUR33_09125 [Pseudomonas sp.] [Pseudomonas sp. FEMGT703P]
MISADNKALNDSPADEDFTEAHYSALLEIAKKNYIFSTYDSVPWDKNFLLWRHDLDFSLNRALALARIEHDCGVKATYFINFHSEFYNPLELGQFQIIKSILALGHHLGVHFDGTFHDVSSEEDLDSLVGQEADLIRNNFGVEPTAFSFHNPVSAHLNCEADIYGGLVNCYSSRFKREVPYCSDSNGYWRFRRLHDVLSDASDRCLQVLTHPGWWQKKSMAPRERIFRSIFGRARALMCSYDEGMRAHARINHIGASSAICFIEKIAPEEFELIDFMWNKQRFDALFFHLMNIHEQQAKRLCEDYLSTVYEVSVDQVRLAFSARPLFTVPELFEYIFGRGLHEVLECSREHYGLLLSARDLRVGGRLNALGESYEGYCTVVASLMQRLSSWGQMQRIGSGFGKYQESTSMPLQILPGWAQWVERFGVR